MERSLCLELCVLLFCICSFMITNISGVQRTKRFLIYPRQAPTRYQFIGGIGIPADLELESLTIGYVLKAEYWLPYNSSVYRENPFWPEYKTKYSYNASVGDMASNSRKSTLRWSLYAYIAERLESYGYKGFECVLKAICEANLISFQRHHSVFAELVHIFLSPSMSADKEIPESIHYKQAERIGKTVEDCDFYECKISLLNWISSVLKVET